ncbi:MAG: putative metal-binding motif-containing protein [Saprospiraceae bacterium]
MKSLFSVVLVSLVTLTFIHQAKAATISWDGGGNDNLWSNATNWDCNCLPTATDDAEIPSMFTTATVIIDINVNVISVHSYANIIVNSSISVTTSGNFSMANGADLTINTTANVDVDDLVLTSVSHSSGQVWNSDFNNLGTITATSIHIFESCDPGYPCFTTMTNHGTCHTTSGGIHFDNRTQVINHTVMNLEGENGILMGLLATNSSFVNNGNFLSNTYNRFRNTTNSTTGFMTFNDFPNSYNPITFEYEGPCQVFGDFNNQGAIILSNPQAGAFYGIQVEPTATFTSTGTLGATAARHPIQNKGICQIDGTSYFASIESVYQAGIENNATFNIGNSANTFACNTNFRNYTSGILTIAECKHLSLKTLYNQGSATNNGVITFDPTSGNVSITQLGTFSNNGIMINCLYPVILTSGENNGIFTQRVMGQKCANFPINNFISGDKINIINGPTSGIFTDIGLTTSAGSFDWSTNTFTPNAACVGLSQLFIQIQDGTCAPVVAPIHFQFQIHSDIWYLDADGDGYGNNTLSTSSCSGVFGYTQTGGDCNDNDPEVYPGAVENCNDKDYNCDGMINSGLPPPMTWYQDSDGDGFGSTSVSKFSCSTPIGYVSNNTDCNDNNGQIYPGATELCDNIDNDCDGVVDDGVPTGTITFNVMSGSWSVPSNWLPPVVPSTCYNVVIPSGRTVIATGGPTLHCRSILIQVGATLSLNGPNINIMGSTTSGITNHGIINISPNSNINISYPLGHGIDNNGTINFNGVNPWDNCALIISHTGQNGIQNNPAKNINSTLNTYILVSEISNNGINNNGNFTLKGNFSGFDITSTPVFNSGTLHVNGNIDFSNGFDLPGANFLYNSGTINNNMVGSIPSQIILPTPSIGGNVGPQTIWIASGGILNNYGSINVFGNAVAGPGSLINHVGSYFSGF